MLGFCCNPRFTEHETGSAHPERPDRVRAIWSALRAAGFLDSANPFPDFCLDFGKLPRARQKLAELTFSPADTKWLGVIHTRRHIEQVERLSLLGGGVLDEGDTPVGPDSFEIAVLAVGAVLRACDAVAKQEVRRCFVAERPPGHHASPDRSAGFCLFNNVAIAARYLQQAHGLQRIAIVDFDVHHGNGTQLCFEDDPSVLYVSLHQSPRTCYPGTGYPQEVGYGPGEGFTLNLAFEPGADDRTYLAAMRDRVMPKLEEFQPEVLLLSAGFDAHRDDPLAQIDLTEEGFGQMTELLVDAAERHAHGRIVSVLEGGYELRALGRSVVHHLLAMQT